MKTVILLAMHGAPPNDFPRQELAEMLGLHGRLRHAAGPEREAMERRHAELEARMRAWPRNPRNDPFHAAALDLAQHLGQEAGCPVVVGFNEFCAPSLEDALDQAVAGAEKVVVLTPMMTRGGEHAEKEIPSVVAAAGGRHPDVRFEYLWPFDTAEVARFLAGQMRARGATGN